MLTTSNRQQGLSSNLSHVTLQLSSQVGVLWPEVIVGLNGHGNVSNFS